MAMRGCSASFGYCSRLCYRKTRWFAKRSRPVRGPVSANRHSFHKGMGRSCPSRLGPPSGKCTALRGVSAAAKASSLDRICSNMRSAFACGVTRNGVNYHAFWYRRRVFQASALGTQTRTFIG